MYSSILMPQSLLAESHHLGVQDLQLQQLGEAVQDVVDVHQGLPLAGLPVLHQHLQVQEGPGQAGTVAKHGEGDGAVSHHQVPHLQGDVGVHQPVLDHLVQSEQGALLLHLGDSCGRDDSLVETPWQPGVAPGRQNLISMRTLSETCPPPGCCCCWTGMRSSPPGGASGSTGAATTGDIVLLCPALCSVWK